MCTLRGMANPFPTPMYRNRSTFTFSPTYVIQGNADKAVMEQTAQTSRADFERWFDELMRERERTAFA